MSNQNSDNVYRGGTYQGGVYRGGSYSEQKDSEETPKQPAAQPEGEAPQTGRHSSPEASRRPVDGEDSGTMKLQRPRLGAGGPVAGSVPPSAPQSSPPQSAPQSSPPQPPYQGAVPAAGPRPPQPSHPQPPHAGPRPPQAQPPQAGPQRGQPQVQPPRPPAGGATYGGASQAPRPTGGFVAGPGGAAPQTGASTQGSAPDMSATQMAPGAAAQAPPQNPQQRPMSAPPSAVAPVSAQPISGSPHSVAPVSSHPYSAQPYSGQPYSGAFAPNAAPVSGQPNSGLPTSGLFGSGQASSTPSSGTVYGLPVTEQAVSTAIEAGKPVDKMRPQPQLPTARALELMTSTSPPAGLVMGRDAEQLPVVAPFFRPEPTKVAMIGGVYLARLLVFRALALGARVAVCTVRPQEWNGLGEAATGRSDRLAVLQGDRPVTVEASQHSPALYVYDVGERGTTTSPVLGPWRTQLTVLPRLTTYGDSSTSGAYMTVIQRLTQEEAGAARQLLRVNSEVLQWLQMLHDDMIALLRTGASERYIWASPTSTESQMFGQAMRTY
ncbi:hypothetical protein [Natronoglycomyces albus]|uniref:Uncharacterized protein n=1 Tax=Natronoglycomyces albus TaxID=2811108 RepID=A0A895XUS1_9ACTN|nr:hypothetical protein [Natronoglycomyces albus]QSB07125.1 hypothetical protein JQS30_03585 [Natronoglycomyces albus]